jgi:hypothetical protein
MPRSTFCRAAALLAAPLFLVAASGCTDLVADLMAAKPAPPQAPAAPSTAPPATVPATPSTPATTAGDSASFPSGGPQATYPAAPTYTPPPTSPPAAPASPASGSPSPPPVTSTPPPAPASGGDVDLHLKVGVALPQTGPNGTLMGFSVDYYLIAGSLHEEARYSKFYWVIEGMEGFRLATQIPQLKQSDNLLLLKDGWRPENGPYRCYVVEERRDGKRIVVSNVCRMQ